MVKDLPKIVLIINNVRSAHNVGAILRCADAFAVDKVYICGYSPYPYLPLDTRLPHLAMKASRAIHKTALGAEATIDWEYIKEPEIVLKNFSVKKYQIVALEQTKTAMNLNKFVISENLVLIVGNELTGVDSSILDKADLHLQIPMSGQKESLNVAAAAAVALYHLRYC